MSAPHGPFATAAEVLALPEVTRAYQDCAGKHPGCLAAAGIKILAAALGPLPLGIHDKRMVARLAGTGIEEATVVASWITRSRPGPHAVTFELTDSDYAETYLVLSEALAAYARLQAAGEGPLCAALRARADNMLAVVETAMNDSGAGQ